MALVYQKTRAEAVCSLEQDILVLLNDKSRMKGDLHVRFREKFEVKVLLLTRLRGERKSPLLDFVFGGFSLFLRSSLLILPDRLLINLLPERRNSHKAL